MKWDFDGIALTPKLCVRCGKKFIFERYKKYLQTRVFGCYAYDYICHDCYSTKNKEKMKTKEEIKMEQQEEKDFNEMAKAVEKYMQKYCHPHNTIIATLDGIEVVAGVQAKPFEVLD